MFNKTKEYPFIKFDEATKSFNIRVFTAYFGEEKSFYTNR